MEDEKSCVAALLHDVVEDTTWTLDDLREAGIPNDIVSIVDLLTHRKHEPYIDYIKRLGDNEVARKVKIADIRHNSDESRLPQDGEKGALRRREKYAKALAYLLPKENGDID